MLYGLIEKGGPVMWLLLGLSILSFSFIVFKFLHFRLRRVGESVCPEELARNLKLEGPEPVIASLKKLNSPLAHFGVSAIELSQSSCSEKVFNETIERCGVKNVREVEQFQRELATIAHVSPLIGLFGTVTGMIAAFQSLEQAGMQVSPSLLAGGIWEALLTTAFGLAIAIPTFAAHTYFDTRVDSLASQMKDILAVVRAFVEEREASSKVASFDLHSVSSPRLGVAHGV
jgi:biopolymer transport protein ExbB